MNITQYCQKCQAETGHYVISGKCIACVRAQGLKYRAANPRQQGKAHLSPPIVEASSPGVHLEGSLHGQIHGGQGALRPSVRRGCTMGF